MVKKPAVRKEEPELTVEFDGLPVTESEAATLPDTENVTTTPLVADRETTETPVLEIETATLPVAEAKVEAPSEEGNKELQVVKILGLKITELEDKLVQLQTELTSHLNKKKNKKSGKGKKVKCKCKDKTVDAAKCKCETKKLNK